MEIFGDLVAIHSNGHLPIPWSVRGPLGLTSGSQVSVFTVNAGAGDGLPDIGVTPIRSWTIKQALTVCLRLEERRGAVADFLSRLRELIDERLKNSLNIALSETLTLEGRRFHKINLVLEPPRGGAICREELVRLFDSMQSGEGGLKVIGSVDIEPLYPDINSEFQDISELVVENGWIRRGDWLQRMRDKYGDRTEEFDLSRLVVTADPQQRFLRYVIPRRGVLEVRVIHINIPGAMLEITRAIQQAGYNILSSRLSHTPPRGYGASNSIFVAACEPMQDGVRPHSIRDRLAEIEPMFGVQYGQEPTTGRRGAETIYLLPRDGQVARIPRDIEERRRQIRFDIGKRFEAVHGRWPLGFVFVSKRFLKRQDHGDVFEEQGRILGEVERALNEAGYAVIDAPHPSDIAPGGERSETQPVVRARLWAGDAIIVVAIHENGRGRVTRSMYHEIGFYDGRNKPSAVLVRQGRDTEWQAGNLRGVNPLSYVDSSSTTGEGDPESVFHVVHKWAISLQASTGAS